MTNAIKKFGRKTFSSLKIWNYRLYFIGQGISLSGTWMQTIAQSWLVLKLTGSGTALGLITALQFLPVLFLAPWGGVIADRFSKRKILFYTQTAAGITALTLGILVATDLVEVWMIELLALSLGLIAALDNPTRQTFMVEMVAKENLPNAVALNSTEVNLARVIGPAIGGTLIATIGIAWCFIVNGLSYIAVLGALYMMRPHESNITPRVARAKGQLREGFRYVAKTPLLKDTLIMLAIIGALAYEFKVSLPLFARFTLNGDAGSFAALTAAMGAGSIVGALSAAHRRKKSPALLARAAFLLGVSILFLAVAPNMVFALFAVALVGALSINFLSLGNVLIQLETSGEMRGRVMALWAVAILGSTPIGGPIIGFIGEYAGPRFALAVGGIAAIITAGWSAVRLKKKNAD